MDQRQESGLLIRVGFTYAQVAQRLLLDVGQNVIEPSAGLVLVKASIGFAEPETAPAAGRQEPVGAFVVEAAQRELLQIVAALQPSRRLTRRLHRW